MALPSITDARNLGEEELGQEIVAAKKQLFELRMEQSLGRLEKPHQIRHLRHRIAQLLTVEREREIVADREAKAAAAAAQPEAAPEAETVETAAPEAETSEESPTETDSTSEEE